MELAPRGSPVNTVSGASWIFKELRMLEKHENRQDGRQPRGTRLVTELVIEGPKKHGGQGLMA